MPFEVGQHIGDYEILDVLGTGGMGQVYRVRNVISNRVEAMKALLPNMTADPDFAARFSAEIRTLATFDHPNIAQLRTAFQSGNQQLMVMEFIEGSTLDRLTQHGALPQTEVIKIAKQILSALSYAHSRGVVHRDIKPANIMVTPAGVVKLMDFGIAKSASEHKLTQTGSTLGSLYYMSPEQVRGTPVDARTDIYSTGVLLYELLSGRRPFRATTTYALLEQQLNETPEPLFQANSLISEALNDVVFTAISKDPAARFQTADAFANALSSAANPVASKTPTASFPSNQPIPIAKPQPVPASASSQNSNRTVWILGGALATLLALVGAASIAPHFYHTTAKSSTKGARQRQPEVQRSEEKPQTTATSVPPPAEPAVRRQSEASRTSTVPESRPPRARDATVPRAAVPESTSQTSPPEPRQQVSEQQPAPEPVPSDADFAHVQDELIQLNSRASVVSASVEKLQQQQSADGLGLRQDMAASYSRMNSYLHAVDADLANRNLIAAQRHMDMAEKEVSTLEKFFNR